MLVTAPFGLVPLGVAPVCPVPLALDVAVCVPDEVDADEAGERPGCVAVDDVVRAATGLSV
ncbi:hypothetical protein GCM10009539_20910 [Cryptosporangium japonicum]|uniref:Secreted protein n=1 Tax=Cryptosporangium japonicum TaxID=80872 RepID=A0ABN0U194_9ACTN